LNFIGDSSTSHIAIFFVVLELLLGGHLAILGVLLPVESFILRKLGTHLAARFETANRSNAIHSDLIELVLWILHVLHSLSRVYVAAGVRPDRLARNYPDLILVGHYVRRRHIAIIGLCCCFPHSTHIILACCLSAWLAS
jgi:hypothetical protein